MTPRTGRPMTSRIRVRGWLHTESPLHVGGIGRDPAESLPIAVDGRGRLYVPGTSLAGALRAWMRGAATPDGPGSDAPSPDAPSPDGPDLNGLWGYATPGTRDGHASRVVVHDALVARSDRLDLHGLPADPLPASRLEVRTSVGIDRVTGTAASEILSSRSVVPPGHYVRFELDVECGDGDREARDRARVKALLDALAAREIRLGAATTRGLGAVRLLDDPLDIHVDRFDSPGGLLAVLRQDPARSLALADLAGKPDLPPRRERVEVRVAWRPLAPVMVGSGVDGLSVDTLPLVTRVDAGHVALVLPGSTIKGVLRSRAEYIERTACGTPERRQRSDGPAHAHTHAHAHAHSAAFRAQLDELAVTTALFGAARREHPRPKDSGDGGDGEAGGGEAGALRAEECLAKDPIPAELWRATTGLHDDQAADGGRPRALPETVLDRLADLGLEPADHVAIDRWTGGAADHLLFRVLEPHGVEWNPLRLSVDLTHLDHAARRRDAALALLLLVLRDLEAGRLPLGAATNRGFGDIAVTDITLTGGPWPNATSLRDALATPELAAAWQALVLEGTTA
ncbi:RAMP superfamily CRISPR-associated protein [Streptomyces sp. 4N509B]|uniref:RAMP superfamily CRISPR-associated protein n=1 Tax=Streptomyces sp. 4N509B TaxID=3457413 RepID=UPI003FD515A0